MLRRLIVYLVFMMSLAAPAFAQDAADAIVRLNRLESQFRQMSGQMEQLQHENQVLKEQLRKFQEDVEFRFQEGRGGGGKAPATGTPPRPAQAQPQRRSDIFDPSEAPSAPGAPQPLGSTIPSAPLTADARQPLPLPGSQAAGQPSGIGELIEEDEVAMDAAPLDINPAGRTASAAPSAPVAPSRGPSVAATSVGDPRADFETAYGYFAQQQYEEAEMGFRRFLQSNPRDRLVPEASYWLGETYMQRSRYREAAEQFLNVSTDYPNTARAPDALLKLGIALNGLGARDRACAVFAELNRKYPQASAAVRQGSEREQRRSKCS
ncbi:tol-pal system protein YbgF [Microvirga puerhi]|uniref:Cell division coordinator CpoB n=1 Tax=Microvirga puerhi TaxID=2876078 RepID=A0ABS7VQJ2_9HYPH|nr:tol-pal system protein YbgF [Microvirga puerhi]MBZ6077287.1 tol-pal system protein YbgF [Microvirga puerhi]